MKELLKNRAVLALIAALAGWGVTALRSAGVPVECPPAAAQAPQSAPVPVPTAASTPEP